MAELQRVDELTSPPIVGQSYLVPTVTYPWFGKVDAWPVMGPKHTDIEHLDFPHEHYHIDVRFLTKRQITFCTIRDSLENTLARWPLFSIKQPPHPDPQWRMRTCRRNEHAYPPEIQAYPQIMGLASAYAGRRCARNAASLLICPHKGFALDTLIPDADGRVVCPLHGLVIDVRAGVVVAPPASAPGAAPAEVA